MARISIREKFLIEQL